MWQQQIASIIPSNQYKHHPHFKAFMLRGLTNEIDLLKLRGKSYRIHLSHHMYRWMPMLTTWYNLLDKMTSIPDENEGDIDAFMVMQNTF